MTDTQHSSPLPHPDIAAYLLGSLDPQDIRDFEQHLASCKVCQHEKAELERTAQAVRATPPEVDLPATLKAKTIAAVEQNRNIDKIVPLRPNKPRSVFLAVAGVAAAVAIFLAGVNIGSQNTDTDGVNLALTSMTGGSERGSARVSDFHGGSKITLAMQDIAATPEGMHYEVVVTPRGAEMSSGLSAGTFRMDKPGDLQVVLTTAGSMTEPITLYVVLKPDESNAITQDEQILISTET